MIDYGRVPIQLLLLYQGKVNSDILLCGWEYEFGVVSMTGVDYQTEQEFVW